MTNHERLTLLYDECKRFRNTLTINYFRRALYKLENGIDDNEKQERVYLQMSEKTAEDLIDNQFPDIRISQWMHLAGYSPPEDAYKGSGPANLNKNSFFALWKDHNNFYPIIIENSLDYGKVRLVGK